MPSLRNQMSLLPPFFLFSLFFSCISFCFVYLSMIYEVCVPLYACVCECSYTHDILCIVRSEENFGCQSFPSAVFGTGSLVSELHVPGQLTSELLWVLYSLLILTQAHWKLIYTLLLPTFNIFCESELTFSCLQRQW